MSSKAKQIGGAKKKFKNAIQFTVIAFVFILYMVPFALVVINSFKSKRDIITNPFSIIGEKGQTLLNYVKAFEKMDYIKAFGNSLFITGLSTFAVIILAAMVAYYFTREKNRFSALFFAMMVAAMIIPFQSIMIPLVSIYGSSVIKFWV